MILVNNSEPYQIYFNNKEYNIPTGRFEVTQELGGHILSKSEMWDKNVKLADKEKLKVEQVIIPEVKNEAPVEVKTEVPVVRRGRRRMEPVVVKEEVK